jgi:hypothetical protein
MPRLTAVLTLHGKAKMGDTQMVNFDELAEAVRLEAERAVAIHGPMHSPHEALGVIREEYKEFEEEVFRFNPAKGRDTRPQMRGELTQLAAMCLRAIHDLGL